MISKLTTADYALLIKNTEIPPGLRQKLSPQTLGIPNLTADEIVTLSAATITAITRLNNPKIRKALKHVLVKLLAAGEEMHRSFAPNAPIGQTNETLEILVDHLNSEPRPDFGNLSSREVHCLVHEDWSPATPGIQLCHDLTTSEVISTPIITRAHLILHALAAKGTKATTAGNLNRKFVASIIEQMGFSDRYLLLLKQHNKVINESDVPALEIIRIVLELADTIKMRKQKFQVTSMGQELMAPGFEGSLFLILFVTFFRDFNLSYRDRMMDLPEFQDSIGYSLYQLSALKDGWHDLGQTSEQLILPSVARIFDRQLYDIRSAIVRHRFLVYLEWFGLVGLKRDEEPRVSQESRTVLAFRKTALLKRLIRFEFS